MRFGPLVVALALLALLPAADGAAQTIQVTPLAREDRVLVSFKLTDAFTEEVRAAIHSGMTVTFVYDVQLRRSATLWVDRTIGEATVTASVKYDNLTRRYLVTRAQDGRTERAENLDEEETARAWLTEFEKLPLFRSSALEPNAEYYLRVRAHTTPRNAAFVWPWGSDIAGLAKFTFLR
ncbi:MAG TPA: DUF4390 domain-containing protein [Vicinamibacterales bacterium]|nr:DUF4390 domain-containing protein [Vicinamibacterales bacterium]